ncbi:hypothetical protein DSM104443_02911 [Usitatibacter rugosus]|uniref:Uncharacterized protein n=1 Tax=Usitatibacter rugosus TaxID=2732067 RepID=A0A6M4GY50_9PROT|nr:hypothetical protein [Usitatibacter rugosus]QJR11828.1 hypothetical protein DSM104443_02911 [Usitatibacter rugosus]
MKNLIAALLFTLPAGFALAQTAPAPAAPAPAAKALATRDEYRTCLRLGDEAVARRGKLQQQKYDYDTRSRQLSIEMKAHLDAKDTVKPGTKLAEAYNTTTEQLNARNMLLNSEADQFDKDIADHNRVSAEASKRCSGLTVSQEDMQAVNAERAAAKK